MNYSENHPSNLIRIMPS